MKWCVWSGGSWVWLVVMTIIPHASYQGCREDDVKVRGINTDILKAGRIDVCHDNNRRPLCGEGFDANVARVICAELGFPMAALHCNDSCLGSGDGDRNVKLSCTESDSSIDDCTISKVNRRCSSHAGVICCRDNDTCPPFLPSPSDTTPPCDCPTPPPSPSCDCATREGPGVVTTPTQYVNISDPCPTATPPTCPPATPPRCNCTISTGAEPETTPPQCATVGTAGGNGSGDSTDPTVGGGSDGVGGVAGGSTDLCTALGGGLGILSAVLAVLLVGVVLGWVWSCRRRRGNMRDPLQGKLTSLTPPTPAPPPTPPSSTAPSDPGTHLATMPRP